MPTVSLTAAIPPGTRQVDGEGQGASLIFDAVYQAYATTVARWSARLGGPGVEVEDITQEVFLIVNRRLPEFRHDSRLATWLFSITAKVVANDRRRRRVRAWWLHIVPRIENRATAGPDTPLEQLEKRQRRARFYAVLDQLSERQRRVLVLFELENMAVVEIAEIMRLRTGNVRVLLHRARAAFLTRMTECELREAREWRETGPRENTR
jgi:RNA polymerase sigma-70 factor (ECF subfamily)